MSLSRIWVIAINVFKEVIRDRVLYLIAIYAVLLFAIAALLPDVAAGAEEKITLDLGLAGIHILGLVVTVFVGTGLINKEIEKRTVLVLISKPVSRLEFILGKHVGLSAVLAVLMTLLTAIYLAVLIINEISFTLSSLLIAVFFTFLEMVLLTAAALLFGVFTSSLLATLLTIGVYLMGHLSQDIVAFGKLSENAGFQRVANGMYLILPDLERLNLRNEAVYGMTLLPSTPELIGHFAYSLLYIALLLSISVAIFSRRQF
ncbi:ABC transporter permease subunit [Oscillatoria sp. CS-180]|uniref:ABC transporter permease n=1 Tax=Oscillatoria sp. CS-180 TaxID=3021720 RepID=UPI00232D2B7D|nr:ABC transporter permease subunit [Oscillatoria sp. CS-180]MDB9525314.1 ABC transporter permease subunit [Oscillatoria sp. CS-180]